MAAAPPEPTAPRLCVPGVTDAPDADIRRTAFCAVAFADDTRTVAVTDPPGRIVADDTDSARDSTGCPGFAGVPGVPGVPGESLVLGVGDPVGVCVGVSLGVAVGVSVGVSVGVAVGVSLGVSVGGSLGVAGGVSVGVEVVFSVGLSNGVSVGVPVAVRSEEHTSELQS